MKHPLHYPSPKTDYNMQFKPPANSHSAKKPSSPSIFLQRRQSGGNLGTLNLKIADILSDAKNNVSSSVVAKSKKKGKNTPAKNNNMIYFPEIVSTLPRMTKPRKENSPTITKTNFYRNNAAP